jgi:hypothetical protein
MKTCWQILEIESTTQIDIIRQAYLARLPLCHPETDPQGFKALRQAYEEALRLAVNPVEEADDEEKDAAAEHEPGPLSGYSGHYWIQKVIVFSPPPGRNLFSN